MRDLQLLLKVEAPGSEWEQSQLPRLPWLLHYSSLVMISLQCFPLIFPLHLVVAFAVSFGIEQQYIY